MNLFYFLLVFVAGIGLTLQLGINSQLRQAVVNPILSSLISFLVGTVALVLYLVTTAKTLPDFETLRSITWWKYLGGLLGVFYFTTVSSYRCGQCNRTDCCWSIVDGIIMRSFWCLIGFKIQPINIFRILGALLVLIGVYFIQRK